MKLLLTSTGIENEAIKKALFELVGKDPKDTMIAFVPTAANFDASDKGWFVKDLVNLKNLGAKRLDIVDISALPQVVWLPRLEAADVLIFSGGNSAHLLYWLEKSGLKDLLPDLLKTRVYVGISAGSIVTNPTLALSNQEKRKEYAEMFDYNPEKALGLVDFHMRPHLGAKHHPHASEEAVREAAKSIDTPVYAIDDETALKVVDGNVEVVGEGRWIEISGK